MGGSSSASWASSTHELQQKLDRLGIQVDASHFYTSALATASFLATQHPGGSAYVIGEAGLINALYNTGFSMNDMNPDYVVVGETRSYSFEKLERAVNFVRAGAKLIGTNPDLTDKIEEGITPAAGSLIAPIELATGRKPYFVGKPNPLIMRSALRYLDEHSENAVMIGDRMDTDIKVGLESGLQTILVLTGITKPEMIAKFPYRPNHVVNSVAEIQP